MLRTHIYLPEDLNAEIENAAREVHKSKAEVIREALEHGIKVVKPKRSASAKALLTMAQEAKKFTGKAPPDLAFNHNYYTWGGEKKTHRRNG